MSDQSGAVMGAVPRTPREADLTSGRTDANLEDAGILLDVPQLAVDELNLELQAALGVEHVKIEAKGLNTGVFLKADFENVAALLGGPRRKRLPDVEGNARTQPSDSGDEEHDEEPSDGGGGGARRAGGGAGAKLEAVGRRTLEAAKHNGKTATLAVAGAAAGGALLDATLGDHGKRHGHLPLPRRSRVSRLPLPGGKQSVVDKVRKQLPG